MSEVICHGGGVCTFWSEHLFSVPSHQVAVDSNQRDSDLLSCSGPQTMGHTSLASLQTFTDL